MRTSPIIYFLIASLCFILVSCSGLAGTPSAPAPLRATDTLLPPTTSPTHTPPPLPSSTATASLTPTATLTLTPTFTHTPSPTPGVLRAKVLPEKLSCRFGPGVMYLYKYGVFQDTVMEVIGRMERSSWVLVQAVGGDNACWVNGDYMELRGEVAYVPAVDPHVVLAWSPYYTALSGVSAERSGDQVTLFWNPLALHAGDSSEQIPYVVEAWVCRGGEIVFEPVGAYSNAAEFTDEAGCTQDSYVRVFAAEKHGYTQWVVVDIPPHPDNQPTSD